MEPPLLKVLRRPPVGKKGHTSGFSFGGGRSDVLINFLKEVAAAAPALPFYYYHIPALTGVKIRAEELLDGIQDKIPTFQGLKFSDTDLLDFGQCVDQNRQQQFAFRFGVDEQLLSALVMGATGAVGRWAFSSSACTWPVMVPKRGISGYH
eukprot:bmy_03559T0